MLLGFYGLLRRSEIISLKLSDVTIIEESSVGSYVKLRIRRSKNDQGGLGAEVIISDISRHSIHIQDRVAQWLRIRKATSPPESPLIPAWDCPGNPEHEQFAIAEGPSTRGQTQDLPFCPTAAHAVPHGVSCFACGTGQAC